MKRLSKIPRPEQGTTIAGTAEVDSIGIADIDVSPQRLRALRPERVEEIADSIRVVGQLQPITVRPNCDDDGIGHYRLVIGRHRLEAAKRLGWAWINAIIRTDMSEDEARLVEIDENICRVELSQAERALHLAERKRIYERLHPETKHGGDRKSAEAKSKSQNENLKAFADDTAGKTGKGRSTVARDLTRANKVAVLADIIGTALDRGDEIEALAKLPEDEQRKLAERAKAGERVSAKTRVKQVARQEREHQLSVKLRALPDMKYGVILADPEWRFEPWSRETGLDRAADNHYPTSCTEVIASRDVPSIAAKDCVLFLWATTPMLPHALLVMAAWGFDYKSHHVWGKDKAGTGYWNREKHELLLIGTRGDVPCPAPGEQWDSLIMAPIGEHSAKPECFLEMIEQYYPTLPKIELNRRGPPRDGWDAWGLEAEPRGEVAIPASVPLESTTATSESATDSEDFPAFLLVENRVPLSAEQQAKVDAAMFKVAPKQESDKAIRAQQEATRKEKARVRIENAQSTEGWRDPQDTAVRQGSDASGPRN